MPPVSSTRDLPISSNLTQTTCARIGLELKHGTNVYIYSSNIFDSFMESETLVFALSALPQGQPCRAHKGKLSSCNNTYIHMLHHHKQIGLRLDTPPFVENLC